MLYHRTLNIGRVMSPTLALIVQREAEIDTFKPVPFYTVALERNLYNKQKGTIISFLQKYLLLQSFDKDKVS